MNHWLFFVSPYCLFNYQWIDKKHHEAYDNTIEFILLLLSTDSLCHLQQQAANKQETIFIISLRIRWTTTFSWFPIQCKNNQIYSKCMNYRIHCRNSVRSENEVRMLMETQQGMHSSMEQNSKRHFLSQCIFYSVIVYFLKGETNSTSLHENSQVNIRKFVSTY